MRRHALIIFLIAALHGGCGVTLAAIAAHAETSSSPLAAASRFLMVHAAAGVGLAALLLGLRPRGRAFAFLAFTLQGGATLFSASLTLFALTQDKLFSYAAPIGGSVTILAWAALAVWTALCLLRTSDADAGDRESL